MEITGFESKFFRGYCDYFKIDNVKLVVKIVNEIRNMFFNSCNDIEEIALKSVSMCSGIMVIDVYFNDGILNTIIMLVIFLKELKKVKLEEKDMLHIIHKY